MACMENRVTPPQSWPGGNVEARQTLQTDDRRTPLASIMIDIVIVPHARRKNNVTLTEASTFTSLLPIETRAAPEKSPSDHRGTKDAEKINIMA